MAISLGAVMGGPEQTLVGELWRSTALQFRDDESRPFLNVVFHFPGSLLKPDYQGLRTAKFSKAEMGLMIQVAVPVEIATSKCESDVYCFYLDAIEQAIEMSRRRWAKHGIDFPFDKARAEVARARRQLQGGVA